MLETLGNAHRMSRDPVRASGLGALSFARYLPTGRSQTDLWGMVYMHTVR